MRPSGKRPGGKSGGRPHGKSGGRPGGGRPGGRPEQSAPKSPFSPHGADRLTLGIHSVREALRVRPRAIKRLGLRDDFDRAPQLKELADLAEAARIEVRTLTAKELDHIGSGHQGAAAIVSETPTLDFEALKAKSKCILIACDGLEDPANLGAILRSAWLLGASGVLIPQDRSVTLTAAAAKVASGGAEHVPVEIASNLPRQLEILREAGFWIFGLAEKGRAVPWEMKLPEKIVWVIGSESSGLRITVERACDELVKLPQVEGGSSFNAAVSATMALYESVRQNGL